MNLRVALAMLVPAFLLMATLWPVQAEPMSVLLEGEVAIARYAEVRGITLAEARAKVAESRKKFVIAPAPIRTVSDRSFHYKVYLPALQRMPPGHSSAWLGCPPGHGASALFNVAFGPLAAWFTSTARFIDGQVLVTCDELVCTYLHGAVGQPDRAYLSHIVQASVWADHIDVWCGGAQP